MTRRTYESGFQAGLLPNTGGNGRGMDAADVDGDGNLDIARARHSDGQIFLYQGDGTGQFTTSFIADPGRDPYGVALADFDNDGKIDLLANEGGSGNPYFFKGNGDGTFQGGVYVASLDTNNYSSYGACDFNNDGNQDLVVVNYSNRQVWYYPGNGDATFGGRVLIGTTSGNTLGVAAPAGRVIGQPFSVATLDRDPVNEGQSITFDASASYDDGSIVNYAWNFGDGTTATGPVVTHTFAAEGNYVVLLTVTDDKGKQDRRGLRVTVVGTPPVADAGGPYTVERGWFFTLNATGSSDDVNIEQFHWDFGDGATSTKPNPEHFYDGEGTYTAQLTVTDNILQTDTTTTTVNVITGTPPVADAGGPYQGAVNGPAVFFDGSGSHDDYGITNYFWDVDATVDADGDGNPTNDRDVLGQRVTHTYTTTGVFTATLTVIDGAGQTDTDSATVSIVDNLPPRVVTVPWVSSDVTIPHETFNGKEITLKGVVYDVDPVTYEWDFGDGSTSGTLPVAAGGHHKLEARHTYPDVPAGTPFVATLTVTDSQGQTASDTYNVVVKSQSLNTEVNVAIDEGLWYFHTQQNRTTGQWVLRSEVATTASAVNAFEANAHLPTGDPGEDPYVETVRRGLTYVLGRLGSESISTQPAGDPDTNDNGLGIRVNENYYPYQGGMVMDALITSGAPLLLANNGPADVIGRRYVDIVQEMVDSYAYGQYDSGANRGGWRYGWNQGPDNSAAQWAAIGLIPAERNFGTRIPDFVKPENLIWLQYSQDPNSGGFGYTSAGYFPWGSAATTASGLVQLAMDGIPNTDSRWTIATNHMRGLWETPSGNNSLLNNFYAMFAFTKAMRLANPTEITTFCTVGCTAGPLDWYGDPTIGFARNLIDKQRLDGSWLQPGGLNGSGSWQQNLVSAWAILILTKALFEVAPEANAGPDRVWGVDIPLAFDGSGSFHPDPFRTIVRYEWDFDGDGVFDASSGSPTATFTYTSGSYPESTLPRNLTVTLRVTDDRGKADTDTAIVTLAVPPHPPLADAGGPYTCTAGLPCTLDGSGSFDIDPTDFISEYAWELDGIGIPDFAEASGQAITHVFPTSGTFNVGLRVKDNGVLNDLDGDGEVDDDERLRDQDFTTVTAVDNLPPVAEAGGPYTVAEGTPVTLDGSGSSDPNGDPLTYAWDLDLDGAYDDGSGVQAARTFPDDGTYTVGLQVSDTLLSATDTATVTVTDGVPTAAFAWSPQPQTEGGTVDFVDQSSSSPDGLISWSWDFAGLGNSNAQNPSFPFANEGDYAVTLTVTDDDGSIGTVTQTVSIVNVAPTVEAGPDLTAKEGIAVSLAPATFTDPGVTDTHTASIDWGDGTVEDGVITQDAGTGSVAGSHVYTIPDLYTVMITVTDDDGGVGSDTLQIQVEPANEPPVANANGPYTVAEGSTLHLDGTGSSDPNDDVLTYAWDFDNDGNYDDATGPNPPFLGLDDGVLPIGLQVSDGALTATATSVVTVTNVVPTVEAGPDQTVAEGDTVTFAGAFSDPGNDTHTIEWTFGDGATASESLTPTHTYADDGLYMVTLTVTDDDGGVDTQSLTVTVQNVAPTLTVPADQRVDEGSPLSLTDLGTFTDPGFDNPLNLGGEVEETFSFGIDWGDGSAVDTGAATVDTRGSVGVLTAGSFDGGHTYADDGVYTVTVTVTDDDLGTHTQTFDVVVANVAPQVTLDPAGDSAQYSDPIQPITITATDVPTDTISVTTSFTIDDGALISGLPNGLTLSEVAGPVETSSWTLAGIADVQPATYMVRVTTRDEDGGVSDTDITIAVTPEDARSTYSGAMYVSTPSINDNVALVELRATVQDITAVSPDLDPDAGMITNATVTFVDRDAGTPIPGAVDLPVQLINAADQQTGVAIFDWMVELRDNQDSESFTIGIVVGGYYISNAIEAIVVTVSKPLDNFVTGGGYVVNQNSSGLYAGNPGLKTNFGFNVKFNKQLTNLQGKFTAILRQADRMYQIKTNAMESLVVDPLTDRATFVSKANLKDVTDSSNPLSISGNLQLVVTLTDPGEPGASDTIGMTLWQQNELWFSSNWMGAETLEQLLDGGNLVIHAKP